MANENETLDTTPAQTASGSNTEAAPVRPAVESAAREAGERNAMFPYAQKLAEDTISLRDDLSKVQSSATEAARLSGDHFAHLLYGPEADQHLSPYGVPPTPNSLDSRKP